MRKILFFFLIPSFLLAIEEKEGTFGGDFLRIERGYICGDIESVSQNPAIIGTLEGPSFLFGYKSYLCETKYSSLALSIPFKNIAILYSLNYLDYGRIKETTHNSKDGTGREYSADSICSRFGLGVKTKNAGFGGNINIVRESINDINADGIETSFGFIFNPIESLFLGGSIKNITLKSLSFIKEKEIFPKEFGIGVGYKKRKIAFNLDLLTSDDRKFDASLGFKWFINSLFFLNVGYIDKNPDFGLSFNHKNISISYNFLPLSFESVHSISVTIQPQIDTDETLIFNPL
ncbi:MAG: hypothetical protein AB1630_10980 [bacterium]